MYEDDARIWLKEIFDEYDKRLFKLMHNADESGMQMNEFKEEINKINHLTILDIRHHLES